MRKLINYFFLGLILISLSSCSKGIKKGPLEVIYLQSQTEIVKLVVEKSHLLDRHIKIEVAEESQKPYTEFVKLWAGTDVVVQFSDVGPPSETYFTLVVENENELLIPLGGDSASEAEKQAIQGMMRVIFDSESANE